MIRHVQVGGMATSDLRAELVRQGVSLNAYAEALLASDRFPVSAARYRVTTVEVTVAALGLASGGTSAELFERARASGLVLCPLELGPHLRLQYLDQPEGHRGHAVREHRAPPGAITIASEPLTDDDDFPKGFYIRCIEGAPWLRGYVSWPGHVWAPDDRFVFARGDARGA